MDNLLNTLFNQNIFEELSYFSCETVLLIIFLLNILLYLIFKRKTNAKRVSDFLTCCGFAFNTILCVLLYIVNINNIKIDSMFLNTTLYVDSSVVLFKCINNLFLLLFVFSFYKLIRTSSYNAIVLNGYLCLVGILSGIVISSNNNFVTFFFMDCVAYFLYCYLSAEKPQKVRIFSFDFWLINIIASLIFYSVLSILYLNDSESQTTILNVCLFMAYMLKIGIFPCINYFSLKNHKNNIIHSLMLSQYFPFIGIIGFVKIFNSSILSGDIFFIGVILFVLLCVGSTVTYALKTKNVVRFFVYCAQFFNTFIIVNFLISLNTDFTVKIAALYLFASFSVFTLISVFKINNRETKLTIKNLKGIFLKNRRYALALSVSILFLFSVIPSGLSVNAYAALKNIYCYDKSGYVLFVMFFVINIVLLSKSLDIILNLYNFDKSSDVERFNKKTTLNYVAFLVSILFLFFVL